MLIDLSLKENYIDEVIKERKAILKACGSMCGEMQKQYILQSIENLKNVKDLDYFFTKRQQGVYRGEVYEDYLCKVTGLDFTLYRESTAPNITAILI